MTLFGDKIGRQIQHQTGRLIDFSEVKSVGTVIALR
jgi:hypothetical protein